MQVTSVSRTPRNPPASEWNVPPGSASDPSAKWKYQLSAPLRWFRASSMRRVADEIYRLPFRILECLRAPYPRNGFPIPPLRLSGSIRETWRLESMFLRSCGDDIQRLSQENHWAGHLDRKMAAQAYLAGTEWAIRHIYNATDSERS